MKVKCAMGIGRISFAGIIIRVKLNALNESTVFVLLSMLAGGSRNRQIPGPGGAFWTK
jgi:hypothetical protein